MLRRYLIANGVSSAVLYGAMWAFVPSLSSLSSSIETTINSYVMDHSFLAPILNRVITVAADVASWF
jgi:hypothetical protein